MEKCYLLFGSNMGDKNQIFAQACLLINNRCGHVVKVSSAYESEPWGFEAEEWFLNRAIEVETALKPSEMLHQLLDIEKELGRVRPKKKDGYASRPVDLDILYFGDRILLTDELVVPHPRLHQRRFALLPLCELIPDFVHPALGLTQRELLKRCNDPLIVRKLETT